MLTDEERDYLGRMTRVMQIIVVALAAGAASFFGIVMVLPAPGGPGPQAQLLLTYMAIAAGLGSFFMALVLPEVIGRTQRRSIALGNSALTSEKIAADIPESVRTIAPLVISYQTVLIIRSALLEGAAFFALVAYMVEWQTSSLVVAGALILILLAGFPTRSKIEDAVDRDRREIDQLRQMESANAR